MMFTDLLKAMQYGNELRDPAKWKKGQMLSTAVGGLLVLGLRYALPDQTFSEEFINVATEGIVSALVVINLLITKASSKKV